MPKAIAYLRTSSAANVGEDKDSEKRQRAAIDGFAAQHGFTVVEQFYDEAVPGSIAVQDREQFAAMLDRIEGNGVRAVIVEDASRFARDLLVQEAGIALLLARDVKLYAANTGDELTDTSDPMRKMVRQIVGAVVEAEKGRLVAKLKAARDRRTASRGYRTKAQYEAKAPQALDLIRQMRAADPVVTLEKLAAGLEAAGIVTRNGRRLDPQQVRRLLARAD
jgi:DNA invertase Pin-like site-specific DNA recombinase